MITVPAKVKDRITAGLKKYQPILLRARNQDINESDTVTILMDVLADVFGYNKYTEITSEYAIKHTYCDLAIKLDNTPRVLIEVKAAGLDLKTQHIRQAVDYGSNSGVDWVVLTNGVQWMIYRIIFAKPIDTELVYEFDITTASTKRATDLEQIYCLTREAMTKSSKASYLEDYHIQKQLLNKFTVGQILLSDPVLDTVKKVLRKMGADSKTSNEEISAIILNEVLKREVLDSERMADAKKKIAKALKPITKPVKPEKDEANASE